MYGNSIEGTDEARQLIKQGHILHELGHMLGLPHEHQRRDAREYVDFDTPASGQEKSFKNSIEPDDLYWPPTCSEDTSCDIHERSWTKPYLYSSIMHYNSLACAEPPSIKSDSSLCYLCSGTTVDIDDVTHPCYDKCYNGGRPTMKAKNGYRIGRQTGGFDLQDIIQIRWIQASFTQPHIALTRQVGDRWVNECGAGGYPPEPNNLPAGYSDPDDVPRTEKQGNVPEKNCPRKGLRTGCCCKLVGKWASRKASCGYCPKGHRYVPPGTCGTSRQCNW